MFCGFISNRTCQGGDSSSIRQQILGIKLAHRKVTTTRTHHSFDPFGEYTVEAISEEQFYSTTDVGHCDSRTTHQGRSSLHIRCGRIPYSNYQSLHCHRMSSLLAPNSFSMHDDPCVGSLLDALEEARYPQTIQR